jgi:hypothetical protein
LAPPGDLRVPLEHVFAWDPDAGEAGVAVVTFGETVEGFGANVADLDPGEGGVGFWGADGDDEEVWS